MDAFLVQAIRFKLRDGFFCEVKIELNYYDFWLAHDDYGVMDFCFGKKIKDVSIIKLHEWLPEVENYIDEFKERYFDEE